MKKLIFLLFALLSITANAQKENVITVPVDNNQTEQALLYKPITYATSPSREYPLLIFLHGAGESCAPLSNIYNSSTAGGPAYYIEHSQWPDSFQNPLTGQYDEFLVLSPQSNCNGWSTDGQGLEAIVAYMVNTYQVDVNRIYFTGLSAGGQGLFDYVTGDVGSISGAVPTPTYWPAAIVPMSMATNGVPNNADVATTLAHNVWVWGFGSESDVFGIYTHLYITGSYAGNSGPTPPALGPFGKFVAYTGGHCCWGQFYTPLYTDTVDGVEMSIYQWMLTKSRVPGLPVTFISFSAVAESTETTLTWTTAQEENSSHFIIQRSTDGKNWDDVASVPTQAVGGYSSSPLTYIFNYQYAN